MNILLSISYFVHLIATIIWLGGLVVFSLLVFPEVRHSLANNNENRRFLLNLQRRFRPLSNLSLVLLLGTGMVQMSADSNYEGFFAFKNTWSIAMLLKHIAFGSMILLMAFVQFSIVPKVQRAILIANKGESVELELVQKQEAKISLWLMGLGLIVLVCTAIATAV